MFHISVSLQAPPHLLSLHLADSHYMVGDQVPFFQHRWENQHVLRSQCQWCRIVTAWKTFFSLHLVLTTACPRYFFVKYHFNHVLEKAVAPRSSTLAWRTPWMEEPGRLQSMGSLRVGHDWVTSLSLFTLVYSFSVHLTHCCATVTTIQLQKFFCFQNWNYMLNK